MAQTERQAFGWKQAFLALFMILSMTSAVKAGDAGAALTIIERHCVTCHLAPGFPQGSRAPMAGAPSFQEIANDRATYTRSRLATFLSMPHFPMKQVRLGSVEIDNLLAYFDDLATTRY